MLAAWSEPGTRVLVGERSARHFGWASRGSGYSRGAAKACVGTLAILNTLVDLEGATSKLVTVVNQVGEVTGLRARGRRDLTGLADALDELVAA